MSSVALFVSNLPFPARAGIVAAADDTVELPDDASLHNHVGTVHAGALFTLGESASGVVVVRELAPVFAEAMVVAKNATIAYRKPARGRIHARGALVEGAAGILDRLRGDGKVTFDVGVTLHDDAGTEVATMTVSWYARRNP